MSEYLKSGGQLGEHTHEIMGQNNESSPTEYPPFDPKRAQEAIAGATIVSAKEPQDPRVRAFTERQERDEAIEKAWEEAETNLGRELTQEEFNEIVQKYDEQHLQYQQQSPNRDPHKQQKEYDYRHPDRRLERTLLQAAADNLADSSNIGRVDRLVMSILDNSDDNQTFFSALTQQANKLDPEKDDWAAVDLATAFVDTTTAFVISREESLGVGLAKGVLIKNEMLADFADDRLVFDIKVDKVLTEPIINQFINKQQKAPDASPSTFIDYLKAQLGMAESEMQSATIRGETNPYAAAVRKAQAIKNYIQQTEQLQNSYSKDINNLRASAHAHHRILY